MTLGGTVINGPDGPVDRRSFLKVAAGSALLPGVGASVLGACSTPEARDNTAQENSTVTLPRFIRYEGVKPDLEPVGEYGTAGFLNYPEPPIQAVADKPGSGGVVRAAVGLQAALPTPMERNAWWQNINSMLGSELKLDAVPTAQYGSKLTTMLAGNDIADIVQITGIPNKAETLEARFTELSDFVAGNAVSNYPLLANIPTATWKNVVFNGGIFGIPMPLLSVSGRLAVRQDVVNELGLSTNVASADEFLALCRELTDAKANRWAMMHTTVAGFIAEMFDVPNVWRNDNGKLVRDLETDEYRRALEFIKKMWDEGLFHPDSFSGAIDTNAMFKGRRVCLINAGGNGIISTYFLFKQADPKIKVSFLAAPKAEGGGTAAKHLGSGIFTFVALRKDIPRSRTEELLRILNCLAGPFGTSEYLAVNFGAATANYTWDPARGGPVATQRATAEKIPVNYLPGAPSVYFSAGEPDIVREAAAYEESVLKNVRPLPTAGLYSPVFDAKNATLAKQITNSVSDIAQGRKPLSQWTTIVDAWRKNGGDEMRAEYEEQIQQQVGN